MIKIIKIIKTLKKLLKIFNNYMNYKFFSKIVKKTRTHLFVLKRPKCQLSLLLTLSICTLILSRLICYEDFLICQLCNLHVS